MAQTRIDQFYKVTSGSKKPESIKDNDRKSPEIRGSAIDRMVSYNCHSSIMSLVTIGACY